MQLPMTSTVILALATGMLRLVNSRPMPPLFPVGKAHDSFVPRVDNGPVTVVVTTDLTTSELAPTKYPAPALARITTTKRDAIVPVLMPQR